ncbi:uncharacterized protein METZ01_LOCUS316334 [marine metagenome]|uniref:Uncharacterized protein n=1 Tax=marine metagenome TaxID=408172 RepID=A0A382NS73_9ZZZZ
MNHTMINVLNHLFCMDEYLRNQVKYFLSHHYNLLFE